MCGLLADGDDEERTVRGDGAEQTHAPMLRAAAAAPAGRPGHRRPRTAVPAGRRMFTGGARKVRIGVGSGLWCDLKISTTRVWPSHGTAILLASGMPRHRGGARGRWAG
ncbi:hypothetical protein KNE206_71710 [Kitasatospora sp. NE20-6]